MWKVIVVFCALGNPCIVFEEDPIKYYKNYDKCMETAKAKHDTLTDSFSLYGYSVEKSEFKCVQDVNSL